MRYRRRISRRRRKLTPEERRLEELRDRLEVRCQILTRGVSIAFERLYSSRELDHILDFIATDLKPAMKQADQADEAYDKMAIRAKRGPTSGNKNPVPKKKRGSK